VGIADQFRHTRESLGAVVQLAVDGWRIAIVHGNGPQVGDELERNERAADHVEPLPLGVLVAATAGWIGYMIQQSLQNALRRVGLERDVLTVITQTVVDRSALEGAKAEKPIGHALDPAQRDRLRDRGVPVGPDAAGRWRRLALTPVPRDIVEARIVKELVEQGKIVIAAGGGGPPVYDDPALLWEGVDAVVDKDRVAAILASRLGAETLLLLTDVDGVYRNWGADGAERIARLDLAAATRLVQDGALGEGMRPKVEAAVQFVQAGGHRAVIAHLSGGPAALRGETGTTIVESLT
jgi:carbamate kinase